MRLAARSSSSAPVTTRRKLRSLRHFSASASSRQAAGTSGNGFEVNRGCRRIARQPRFLGGEAQHRREPSHRAAEQLIEHGEAGFARQRGIRIAIERVLADIEIERRQIGRHERAERGEDALVIEIRVSLAHQRIELGEPMQHQPLKLRHPLGRDALGRMEMRQIAEHPAQACCAACGRYRRWS